MSAAGHRPTALAVILARLNSRRLPGKALLDLAGRPLIGHVIDRLKRSRRLDGIVVATSDQPSDDPLAARLAAEAVPCFRGPLDDVLGRMRRATDEADPELVVRISGDSPFIDPGVVDRLLELAAAQGNEITTNVARRTFPKGQSVEVLTRDALHRLDRLATDPADREHVTTFVYRNPDAFSIVNLDMEPPRGDLQLSVDTAEDFALAARILELLGRPAAGHDVQAVIAAADAVRASAPA